VGGGKFTHVGGILFVVRFLGQGIGGVQREETDELGLVEERHEQAAARRPAATIGLRAERVQKFFLKPELSLASGFIVV